MRLADEYMSRRLVCFLRHPYMFLKGLRTTAERLCEPRLGQAVKNSESNGGLVGGVEDLVDCREDELASFLENFRAQTAFWSHFSACKRIAASHGGLDSKEGELLYVLCRAAKPRAVVETGVANGFSSLFILQALADNAEGHLYSIENHCGEGFSIPPQRKVGWVVPTDLRNRWRLILGDAFWVLPKLCSRLGGIDLFLHDSSHTYTNISRELRVAWQWLDLNGLLVADDAAANAAFSDFAGSVGHPSVWLGKMAGVRKEGGG